MLPLPVSGAGDESEWRWRCGCRCFNLYPSAFVRSGGTAVSLLWASAERSIVPVTPQNSSAVKTGMVPISKQTYALKKILMKVHIDVINYRSTMDCWVFVCKCLINLLAYITAVLCS